jgi:hypothetical protein
MERMNTEQHAGNILHAWKFADRSNLELALSSAFASCVAVRSISHLENEKSEVLQAVVEHLRDLGKKDRLPNYSNGCGALTLLAHLSTNRKSRKKLASSGAASPQKY